MNKATLSKQDFKNYLLAELADSRQEELIFWKKKIPLPIDLIYTIFDKRGNLFKIYLDHIASVCLFDFCYKNNPTEYQLNLESLPTSDNRLVKKTLSQQFGQYYSESNIKSLTQNLSQKLLLVDYGFSESNFINSLSHQGRKYKRLYLPKGVKDVLFQFNSDLKNNIGVSNGDMFGNIVADYLGVYRSGFSDAFAAIFNKLLDFVLESSSDSNVDVSSASQITIRQVSEPSSSLITIRKGSVSDGSLWEPDYVDAKPTYLLNEKHPYWEFLGSKLGVNVLLDFVSQFSYIESETIRSADKRVIESLRQDLSRKLRLLAEK